MAKQKLDKETRKALLDARKLIQDVAKMDGNPISPAETFVWWFAGSSSIADKLWLSAAAIAALAAAR